MNTKKFVQLFVVTMLLITSFVYTGGALAWSNCPVYLTVKWGDTLSGIAALCGTTVDAIRVANPGLGWWLYAGQVLYIPTGYTQSGSQPTYGTYVVQPGDTLGKIAARGGTNISAILAVNAQIQNPSLIYPGQVINLPGSISVQPPAGNLPPPPYQDDHHNMDGSYSTLNIAYRYGMYVRGEPNGKIIASAMDGETMYYRTNSILVDKKWKVWVEVKLYPPIKGQYTGWLLVRDQFGTYFTDPEINP